MKTFAILASAALASGVSAPALAAKPKPPTTLMLASNTCLLRGEAAQGQSFIGAIVAVVVPLLVEMAIDATVAELGKVRTITSSDSINFNLYRYNSDAKRLELQHPSCVTVLTGEFSSGTSRLVPANEVNVSVALAPGASLASVMQRLNLNNITADKLYSVFEAQAIPTADGTGFRYKPKYVRVFELTPGQRARKQGVVFNLSLRGPGAEPNGTVYSLAPISLGEVEAGFELHEDRDGKKIAKLETGLLTIPGLSDGSYRTYLARLFRGKADEIDYMPVNLKAEVLQTQKPTDADAVVAKLLTATKSKISGAVGTALDPGASYTDSQALMTAQIALQEAKIARTTAVAGGNAEQIELAELKVAKAQQTVDELSSN